MKKVAICISGIPRGHYCLDAVKRIAKYNDTSVFIWYWNDSNTNSLRVNSWRKSPVYTDFRPEIFKMDNINLIFGSGSFNDMIPIFKEQRLKITKPGRNDLGIYGMTYAIMRANQMREQYESINNMNFDCVIRARFELKFLEPGNTNYNPNAIFRVEDFDMNQLWISHTNVNIRDGMCDCLAFSNSEIMSHYSTVYERLYELSMIEMHSPEIIFHHNTKHLKRQHQYILKGF